MEPIDALVVVQATAQQHADSETRAGSVEPVPFLLGSVSPDPVAVTPSTTFEREHEIFSRSLDVVIATMMIVLILPLMAVCALAVLLSDPGPVLFRQSRIGRDGQKFNCLKFRTMVLDGDAVFQRYLQTNKKAQAEWLAVQKLQHDPRVTAIGRFLRRYCLDELPQLINVLRGDMSIVGPRPIVADEISRYGARFFDYCSVKPGLTGLWQVSGRHKLTYEQRVQLDAQYARTKCTSTDLAILWRTVGVVLLGLNQ